jgi:hypothetical protein
VEVGTGTSPLCRGRAGSVDPWSDSLAVVSDPSGTGAAAGGSDLLTGSRRPPELDALAARCIVLADDDFAGYSPIYERIARELADDDDALALLAGTAPVGRTPVLALAAVHDIVLAEPDGPLAAIYAGRVVTDPWPPFRELLLDRSADVLDRMATRSIQTNEVGRSAALLPALAAARAEAVAAGDERPLALVELGPSAGLNLLLDRYAVTYRRGDDVVATVGDPASPVRLECEVRGPAEPVLDGLPVPIGSRVGLDISPVDVTDPDARRWLSACVWPGVPDRPERLAAAIELARLDPPHLVVGDAVTDLAPLVASLPHDVLPVVISTWALAYLGRDGRSAVLASLDEVGTTRDLALVSAEEPRITPWVPALPAAVEACGDADGDGTGTLLGLRTWRGGEAHDEALALCHPHVRWIAWVPGAGGSR